MSNSNTNINKYNLINLSYMCLFMVFIILMFSVNISANSKLFFVLSVKYSFPLMLGLESLALIFLWSYNKLKIDLVLVLLFIQLNIYTIALIISSDLTSSSPYYLSMIESIVLYSLCLIMPVEKLNKFFVRIAEASILIISMQLLTVWLSAFFMGVITALPKSYISIPIGNSNFIACFLNIFIVVVLNLEHKKWAKIIFTILSILSIFGTKSKAGISILIFILLFEYINKSFKTKSFIDVIKFLVFTIIIFSLTIFLVYIFRGKLSYFFNFLNDLFNGGDRGFTSASNGRLLLYKDSFKMFLNKPMLGYGLSYSHDLGMLSHNIIFDQLLKAGIFNLFIFTCYISIMLKRFIKYRKLSKEVSVTLKILVIALVNSMVEPNIGSFSFNFFFWIFCGIGMLNCYESKNKKCNQSVGYLNENINKKVLRG